jgi:CubicO group peptidase (beta-lactamase class C family)
MVGSITRRACLKRIASAAAACTAPGLVKPMSSLAFDVDPQPTSTEVELAAMAEIARLFISKYKVPGLSVAIARHGEFVYQKAFGRADDAQGEQVTPSHLFRIASISKPITSVAIFSLIEKGRLRLGDLVFGSGGILQFDYGSNYSELARKITIEHLLTHTSGGWENDLNDPMFFDPHIGTHELIASTLRDEPLEYEPGKHFAYSNFGYCLLGRVLEKITGNPYEEFVQQEVLARCDIKNMRIAGNTLREKVSSEVVYHGQNGEDPYNMNVRRMDSHGGWIGTPSDLVQFAMHLDGFSYTPSILDKATIATMTTPCEVSPIPHYAKGWFVNDVPNWWHGGSLPGTITIMVRTASGLCWAAFANTRAAGMDMDIDRLMWDMATAVPAWHATTPTRRWRFLPW